MASVARKHYERYAVAEALNIKLTSLGWSVGEIRKGFQPEDDITPPTVAVRFLPSAYIETQLGRNYTTEKSFARRVQIDCYMETEARADTIADDVADFIDEMFLEIKDPAGNTLGNIYCPNSEGIIIDTLPPLYRDAEIKRWRGIVTAELRSDYF